MEISIIIPVYNSAKYLKECLDSVLVQTYTNFEVMLINDGSTDNSGSICDAYSIKDSRFKVFHKENGGVSSARNIGLDNAKGKWICFLDSDDSVSKNYLKDFIVESDKTSADIFLQSFVRFNYENPRIKSYPFQDETISIAKSLKKYNMTLWGQLHGKFFKSNIITNNKIRFDESLHFGEDCKFYLDYLFYCESLCFSSTENYNYRSVSTGLSVRKSDYKSRLNEFLKINESYKKLLSKSGIINDFHKSYYAERVLISIFKDTSLNDSQKIESLIGFIQNYKEDVLSVYKEAKGIGRLFYFLLKKNKIWIYYFLYKKLA